MVCGICGQSVVRIANGRRVGQGHGLYYQADGLCYKIKYRHENRRLEETCGKPYGVCTEEEYAAASKAVEGELQVASRHALRAIES